MARARTGGTRARLAKRRRRLLAEQEGRCHYCGVECTKPSGGRQLPTDATIDRRIMGYYTKYDLDTIPDADLEAVRASFEKLVGYSPFDDRCKWYEAETDLREVSKLHPSTVIFLSGEGEENGDVWIAYAFNGELVKHEQPEWVPPPAPPKWVKEARRKAKEPQP